MTLRTACPLFLLALAGLLLVGCASTPYGPLAATYQPSAAAKKFPPTGTSLHVAVAGVDARAPAAGMGTYVTLEGERLKVVNSNRSFDFSNLNQLLAQALTNAGYTVDPAAPVTVTATLNKLTLTMQECSKWGVNMATEYQAELHIAVAAGTQGLASRGYKERHYGEGFHALRDRAKSTNEGLYMAIYMANEEGVLINDLSRSLCTMLDQGATDGHLRRAIEEYYGSK